MSHINSDMTSFICQYCSKECKNSVSHKNHERYCPKNSLRIYKNGMTGKKGANQYTYAIKNGLEKPVNPAKGKPGRKLSDLQKKNLSTIAKSRGFGGYRENAGRSKKFRINDSFGNEVCLQSTYELRCSELLYKMGIKWVRPPALMYGDKRYFADFYLPEHDIYLDPKNSFKAILDWDKIEKVKVENNINLYVLLEHQLTENYIKSLCR